MLYRTSLKVKLVYEKNNLSLLFSVYRKYQPSGQPFSGKLSKVRKKAKIRNRYNQVPHTQKVTKTQENITYKTAKRSAISQQVTTRLTLNRHNSETYMKHKQHKIGMVGPWVVIFLSPLNTNDGFCLSHIPHTNP